MLKLKGLDKRSFLAIKNVLMMLVLKGGNIIISLLYVPLLINTLNTYNYGVWLTITSIIAWLNLFDIGLGNGLRNNLSKALAEDNPEKANILISTSYVVLITFVVLLIGLFAIVNIFLDWNEILNIDSEISIDLKKIVSVVFYFFSLQFALKLINSILLAFQKPALSSLIIFITQLLSYVIIFFSVKVFFIDSFVYLAWIISAIPVFVLLIVSIYMFKYPLKEYLPKLINYKYDYIGRIFNLGLKFFLLQIITIIIYQTNNLIIAHKLGQSSVTDYNIAYKYLGIISMIFTIILTPFWSATTDAYHRDDFEWIKKAVLNLNLIWIGMIPFGIGLLIYADEIYFLWLGDSVQVDKYLLGLFLVYFMIFMRYGIYGYILNGIGKVKVQLIITASIALLYIPFTLFLAERYNLNGIIMSMISFALVNALWSHLQYSKLINKTAKGIWDQ